MLLGECRISYPYHENCARQPEFHWRILSCFLLRFCAHLGFLFGLPKWLRNEGVWMRRLYLLPTSLANYLFQWSLTHTFLSRTCRDPTYVFQILLTEAPLSLSLIQICFFQTCWTQTHLAQTSLTRNHLSRSSPTQTSFAQRDLSSLSC